jgi:hypothetical protein
MDPYLEEHWGDVHTRLTTYASDHLNRHLPNGLRARIEESVTVEADYPDDDAKNIYYPDLQVLDTGRKTGRAATKMASGVVEPIILERREPRMQRSVHIVATDSGQLVTAIEILSPSNKIGTNARNEYQQKQINIVGAGASLVEIDLIRSGKHVLLFNKAKLPRKARTEYFVSAIRGWEPGRVGVYPVPLRETLPIIRIPLRRTDEDVSLDLQSLIEQAYENGAYDTLNYREEPLPELDAADAAWADELLKLAGKR